MRAWICFACVLVMGGSVFADPIGLGTVWLEGDAGGNTVTVGVGDTAAFTIWFSYQAPADTPTEKVRCNLVDAMLRHNSFSNSSSTWDAQDGTAFEAVEMWEQGPWGGLARPLEFDHTDYFSRGVLPPAEVYPGNLNASPMGYPYYVHAGSRSPLNENSGLIGSTTSWYFDQIVIRGVEANWDPISMAGSPDTLNFPRKTSAQANWFCEHQFYGGAWHFPLPYKAAMGVGSPNDRLFVRVVPEPTSVALLGMAALATVRRRR